MGKLEPPLGKEVLAEVMVEFRGLAKEGGGRRRRAWGQRGPAEARLLQGTLQTDKGELSGSSAMGGRRCLEHEGRMPVRQPYPAVAPINRLLSVAPPYQPATAVVRTTRAASDRMERAASLSIGARRIGLDGPGILPSCSRHRRPPIALEPDNSPLSVCKVPW